MILVSSFIYADEVRDVNGEARGFSNTNVIIKIKVQDNGAVTANGRVYMYLCGKLKMI